MTSKSKILSLVAFVGLACVGTGLYFILGQPNPPRVVFSKQIEVPANVMWLDTSLDVKDKTVTIKYDRGEWTNGGDNPIWSDAKGATPRFPDLLVQSAKIRELVGKTGEGHFSVGDYIKFSGKTGRLYLSINDVRDTFGDNAGAVMVTVSFGSKLWVGSSSSLGCYFWEWLSTTGLPPSPKKRG